MASIQFTPSFINKVPFSDNKRIYYTDSHPRSKIKNFDLMLVVGKQTKTAYMRYRFNYHGARKQKLIQLSDMTNNAVSLSELRDMYVEKANDITRDSINFLKKEKYKNFTFKQGVDFYLKDKGDVSDWDREQLLVLCNQVIGIKKNDIETAIKVGDLVLAEFDRSLVKEIIEPFIDKGSLYSANMKREFIQRIWNYLNKEHEDVASVLVNKPNPASFSMKKTGFKKRASTKQLPKEEYTEFFKTVNKIHRSDFRDLLYLFLILGQHPFAEICKMRWDQIVEFDGNTWWKMEEGFHKVDNVHTVPLPKIALDIINRYKGNHEEYVFWNIYDKANLHSKATFKNVIGRLRAKYNFTWDVRCLRASFVTTINEINPTYVAGWLTNDQTSMTDTTSSKIYHRGDFKYHDYKLEMMNAYVEIIERAINEAV